MRSLAARLVTRGELFFSRLRVGGQVVSVLYDIRKGARQYNIKMGFDPAFSSRVSLGLLHLGTLCKRRQSTGWLFMTFWPDRPEERLQAQSESDAPRSELCADAQRTIPSIALPMA